MAKFLLPDEVEAPDAAIPPQQREAAAAPHRPTNELLGNFSDFSALFEQLEEPPLMELGKPLPKPKYMPRARAGSCQAAHNRALLDDTVETAQRPATTSQMRKGRRPAAGGS